MPSVRTFPAAFVFVLGLAGSAAGQPNEYESGEESTALESLRLDELALFAPPERVGLTSQGSELRVGVPRALTSDVERRPLRAAGGPVPWLQDLTLPDIPVQWRAPVVRYLEYFKDSPRGRRLMSAWLRRSSRYGSMIRDTLRREGLPEDLRCVAMAESGFDPTVRSRRGAVGMWQFVSRTGAEYGLHADRWVDERMDPIQSTAAAASFLGDLYRRLGRWELALAAYNMGYPALLRAIRKYNTNDYWTLAELEAGLPFETTVYVAKIMACTVVMRNPERFGYDPTARDASLAVESFVVGGGVNLGQLARAAGAERTLLAALNPQLRRGRTPPGRNVSIHIPAGQSDVFARAWARIRAQDEVHVAYTVRFGEDLADIARRYRMSLPSLRTLNGIATDERMLAGTVLLVSAREPIADSGEPPVVAIPPLEFSYPDRRRAFYRALGRDSAEEIAEFFHVHVDDLRRWNGLDPAATLHSGMMLQLFVPEEVDLSTALVLDEAGVRLTTVGSEQFFDSHEARNGRRRFFYTVVEGDTLRSLARRFDLSVGSIARINRFSRRSDLDPGQQIILYADVGRAPPPQDRDRVTTDAPPARAPRVRAAPGDGSSTGGDDAANNERDDDERDDDEAEAEERDDNDVSDAEDLDDESSNDDDAPPAAEGAATVPSNRPGLAQERP